MASPRAANPVLGPHLAEDLDDLGFVTRVEMDRGANVGLVKELRDVAFKVDQIVRSHAEVGFPGALPGGWLDHAAALTALVVKASRNEWLVDLGTPPETANTPP